MAKAAGRADQHGPGDERGAAERPGQPGGITIERVKSRTGRWLVLHGASLLDEGAQRVAIISEPAHPERIFPLLMAAYQLTERECKVTDIFLYEASTKDIADNLAVSPPTVQQHLKNIFDKTGVHSRRDLVGAIFFTHYEPRFSRQRTTSSGRNADAGRSPCP